MSILQMSTVWAHSKHQGSELLVLLAIADFADDAGFAWPSIPTLAKKSRLSERSVYTVIANLQASGELEKITEGGGRKSTRYRVSVPTPANPSPPEAGFTPPLKQASPEPSIEPSPSTTSKEVEAGTPPPRIIFQPDLAEKNYRPSPKPIPLAGGAEGEARAVARDCVASMYKLLNGNTVVPLTNARKARYGKEFKEAHLKGVDRATLLEAVDRIAERWEDYQLSVEQAIRDKGKRTNGNKNAAPERAYDPSDNLASYFEEKDRKRRGKEERWRTKE